MSSAQFEIEDQGEGQFLVRVDSLDGDTVLTIGLSGASEASGGALTEDRATARATMNYLLTHQDAADLPWRVEIADVLAAYDDAAEKIAALRD